MMRNKILLSITLILGVLLQLIYLNAPIDRDSGYYLYAGHLVLSGRVPFRDYFDHKPPGMHYFVAGVFKLFGESLHAVRYSTIAVNLFSAFLLYLIGRRLWSARVGALASVLFLFGLPLYEGYTTISGMFILFFGCLGLLFYLLFLGDENRLALFFSGVFLSVSLLFKQTGALTFLAVLVFHLLYRRYIKAESCLSFEFSILASGFILPLIVFMVYLNSENALPAFVNSVISKNISSYHRNDLGAFVEYSFKNVMAYPLVWVFSVCFVFLPKTVCDRGLVIVFVLIASLVPTLVRQYPHYYIPALGFASLLSSVSIITLWGLLPKLRDDLGFVRIFCFASIILMVSPLFYGIVVEYRLMQKQHLLRDYLEVADYVRAHTKPSERILVVAKEPYFYFLSQREAPNEFIFISEVNYYPGIEDKMIQDSLAHGVRYFIVVENPYLYQYAGRIHDFIVENSVLEETWPGKYPIKVYRRV